MLSVHDMFILMLIFLFMLAWKVKREKFFREFLYSKLLFKMEWNENIYEIIQFSGLIH